MMGEKKSAHAFRQDVPRPAYQTSAPEEDRLLQQLFERLSEYRLSHRPDTCVPFREPSDLEQLLKLDRGEGEADWSQILRWVEVYLEHSVVTHHPRFLNRMWSGANLPSIIGEIVTAVSNTSAGTFESAPVSTLMEKHMIQRMLELVGFPEGDGQMTTGSSNANLIAMMAARNWTSRQIKQQGLFGQRELFAFVSQDAHYSLDKAANILGIGADHLVKIPLDNCGRMDIQVLGERLQTVVQSGGIPFFVCATAGTTVRGAYDPIQKIRDLKHRYDFWLHVDGAWGGAAIFSEQLRRKYLGGIGAVDSFTFDFHKMAGTALICNILLFKNGDALRDNAQVGDTSYIFGADHPQQAYNLGAFSLQCGRRVDSLKWFLDWKFFGQRGFGKRVESYHALAEYAESVVARSEDLEMVAPRESFNVCFRFTVPDGVSVNDFNRSLRDALHRHGKGLIGSGYIEADYCLRLLIANPEVDEAEIDAFFNDVIIEGNLLLGEIWPN